jgi:hypothetical protein
VRLGQRDLVEAIERDEDVDVPAARDDVVDEDQL